MRCPARGRRRLGLPGAPVRQDEIREGVEATGRWYAQHPETVDADEAERVAAADELGETA
jgi:hypothetical protein